MLPQERSAASGWVVLNLAVCLFITLGRSLVFGICLTDLFRRLLSTFNPEQEHRYNMYKRSTLNKSNLKRIVNQTVSQSVTAMPLIAIGAYGKFFTGEIISHARDVQQDWAKAYDKIQEIEEKKEPQGERIPNPHRGGLLPDHLREALRRYKGDGEGAGVGFANVSLSMMGLGGSGTWRVGSGSGARRLFR